MTEKHPVNLKYDGGLEKLAEDIGNLRYDALEKFLNLLSEKLVNDGNADKKRKRTKLAKRLSKASNLVLYAANEIKEAWKISAPHMKFWVIASISRDKYVTGYYVDRREKGNEWTKKAEEATLFTKKDAEEHYNNLLTNCGRGTYWLLCLKDLPVPKEAPKPTEVHECQTVPYSAEAHAPLNATCEKCGRVYCDHENKY